MANLKVYGKVLQSNNNFGKVQSIELNNVTHVALEGNNNNRSIVLNCIANNKNVVIAPYIRERISVDVKGNVQTLECDGGILVFGNVALVSVENCLYIEGNVQNVKYVGNRLLRDAAYKVKTREQERKEQAEREASIGREFDSFFSDILGTTPTVKIPKSKSTKSTLIKIDGNLEYLKIHTYNISMENVIRGNINSLKSSNCANIKGVVGIASAGNCITTSE